MHLANKEKDVCWQGAVCQNLLATEEESTKPYMAW